SLRLLVQPATRPHHLPLQPTPFIGRANELAQIAERLTNPDCRLLSLVGAGGVGKTRLALQAAAERVADFAQGVYFVSLAPISSADLVASAMAGALDISFYGSDDPNTQIVNYLRSKHLLLLVDNVEHVLAGTDLLAEILLNAEQVNI